MLNVFFMHNNKQNIVNLTRPILHSLISWKVLFPDDSAEIFGVLVTAVSTCVDGHCPPVYAGICRIHFEVIK